MFESTFLEAHIEQIVATIVSLVFFTIFKFVVDSLIRKFGRKSAIFEGRINLVIKYVDYLIYILAISSFIVIWGIDKKQLFLVISSILTVLGVALFAQWSILSNITAGIILFFSFPFKIGDKIRILDKDFPIEAEITDIEAFYTLLKTADGELISFPNNLLLQKGIAIMNKVEEADSELISENHD
ncbi:MAG: mechanosensitive ion channel [Bacteroidota bacterium]|nr:mechanosensitive ion channel [Bacteroidota bacterium]